jgi:hypothetical protein
MSKNIVLIVIFLPNLVFAEIFDPFYLNSDRDYINKIAWLEYRGTTLFYYDVESETQIEAIVARVRELQVLIQIDTTKMGLKQIKNQWVKFLHKPKSLEEWKGAIKILKKRPIPFEWAIISAAEFQKTCAELTYSIKSRVGIYWLSDKQEEELLRLSAKKGAMLRVNMTAIKGKSPYRSIPASKVFMVATG